jgi:excinuclease ABC subunit C
MVAFTEGEPSPSLYRKFNLKYNLAGQDDPAGIGHILRRRLNHAEWIYPQLVLVDGGKTQVSAAFEALKEKGRVGKIALLGIAKQVEVIVIPKIEKEKLTGWKMLRLSRHEPELQLLQAVRDEAHRFAQKYYQEFYSKKLLAK